MCERPEMEQKLFELFVVQRQKGRLIRRGWFRRIARRLFAQEYHKSPNQFVFSLGWFQGFQHSGGMSC